MRRGEADAAPWSGNIRELEHAIEKAVIICDGAFLSAGLFQLQRRNEAPEMPAASTLEDMEKQMIRRTLDKCGGNLGGGLATGNYPADALQ